MKNNSYVFALITCGGSVGPAMRQLEKLILEKGLKLSAGYGVIMPDNYIVFYNPPTQDSISLMFEREEEMIKEVAETVLNNAEHSFSEDLNLIGRLFGPLAARTFQPKNRDRHFWLEDTCNGCGTCAKLCPVDNIIFRESRPIWLHQCEQCFACIHSCPKRAIQYKQGTLKKGRYCNPKIRLQELYISKD
jgi:ferredoxin